MIDAAKIAEIIDTYQKHGWMIRRILLTKEPREKLSKDVLPQTVAVVESEIDAAWFSRPPIPGGVAWELRYLGELPYALVEKIDEQNAGFENSLQEVEQRLTKTIAGRTYLDNQSN